MPRDFRGELDQRIAKEDEIRNEIANDRKRAQEQREQDLKRIEQTINTVVSPGATQFREHLGKRGRRVDVYKPKYDNGAGVTVRVFRPDANGEDQELLDATLKLILEDDSIVYEWSGKQGGEHGAVWKDERPRRDLQSITSEQVFEKLSDLYLPAPKLTG